MRLKMKESEWCEKHAERQIRLRRKAEMVCAFKHGSTLLASMLAEGKLIDEALEPLKLTYEEKVRYVANNSVLIKAGDGHEAIQIVWTHNQAICIHRLLSKEFRSEFQAYWLGVWTETLEAPKEQLVAVMNQKIAHREERRKEFGVNGELCFASTPAPLQPHYEQFA